MNELLAKIIDAHGGMDRWKAYKKVDATIVSGGGFFALKGMIQDPDPRRMSVWLHEERAMGRAISARFLRQRRSSSRRSMVLSLPNVDRQRILSPAIR
jgi:hypothetical protein